MAACHDLAPGTRVTWRREVYRTPFASRPLDSGEVVENDGSGFVRVRADHDGQVVTGPWAAFSKERS